MGTQPSEAPTVRATIELPAKCDTRAVRECEVCHTSFRGRSHARTCSAKCRKRLSRGDNYRITDEDRAAMDRVALLVPIPVPAFTAEQYAAAIAAARRNDG